MSKTQQKLFNEKFTLQYVGILRKKAKNRGARPLSSKDSLHLVLRSSFAKAQWSFQHPKQIRKVKNFIEEFSKKKGIQIISLANVGNHLHLHIKIPNRTFYKAWIRGLTSGIAMLVAGLEGLKKIKEMGKTFWDYRPFTRIIRSFKAFLNLKDYIKINQFEGLGMPRTQAVIMIKGSRGFFKDSA